MRTAKTLIRLGRCPGWSESSLGAQPQCWFCHEAAQLTVASMCLWCLFRIYLKNHETTFNSTESAKNCLLERTIATNTTQYKLQAPCSCYFDSNAYYMYINEKTPKNNQIFFKINNTLWAIPQPRMCITTHLFPVNLACWHCDLDFFTKISHPWNQ